MKANIIVFAIPAFFALIGLELLLARWQRRPVYRANTATNDIACGTLQILAGAFFKLVTVGIYVSVYESRSLAWFPTELGVWSWVLGFVAVDFCYYWLHRMSHEMNFLWAGHSVHHQSEDYNLAVALRQSVFHMLFAWVFYVPLAFLGMPVIMHFTLRGVNSLYQFWIHTRLIGKLGPLEWLFNTPSHHRVHHARDARYIDRNHAGTLIIWDRIFGTFAAEEEEPRYGTTKALASWNPVWANVEPWVRMWRLSRSLPRWRDKLALWFRPPAWLPEGYPREEAVEDRPPYDADAPAPIRRYVLVHFALVILGTVAALGIGGLDRAFLAVVALWVATSLVSFGGLFEGRRWAPLTEFLRLLATSFGAGAGLWSLPFGLVWSAAAGLVGLVALLVWLSLLAEHRGHFMPAADGRGGLRTRLRMTALGPGLEDAVLRSRGLTERAGS